MNIGRTNRDNRLINKAENASYTLQLTRFSQNKLTYSLNKATVYCLDQVKIIFRRDFSKVFQGVNTDEV